MNRRYFIARGCMACLGFTLPASLLQSCRSTRYVSGTTGKDGVFLNQDAFKVSRNGATAYLPFVILHNELLQYPIYVYRFSGTEYTALWMSCSHQGAELQAAGDHLQCPAHGSEFDNRGNVTNGPADKNLRSFPVTVDNNQLFIDLRKQ